MGHYAPRGVSKRVRDASRYRVLREAGSCRSCGAEAQPGRTRCTPCGQKDAAYQARWRQRRSGEQA